MRLLRDGFCLALLTCASAVWAGEPIEYTEVVRQNPPQHIHVARIDLTDPRVQIVIAPGGADPDGPGRWETVLRTPSEAAKALNLNLAINADYFDHQSRDGDPHHFFAGDPARSTNLIMINGQVVTAVQAGAALMFDEQNHPSIAVIGESKQIPASARQIIAGSLPVVKDGKNPCQDGERAPRTLAGIAQDGKTLVLVIVDGRRPDSRAGMTLKEAGDTMIQLGCNDAINLDGGGSSAMALRDKDGHVKVVNTPSDGSTLLLPLSVERPVAYAFGIRLKP